MHRKVRLLLLRVPLHLWLVADEQPHGEGHAEQEGEVGHKKDALVPAVREGAHEPVDSASCEAAAVRADGRM